MVTRAQALWVFLFALAASLPDNSIGLFLKFFFPQMPVVGGLISSTLVAALMYIGLVPAPRLGAGMLYTVVLLAVAIVTSSFGQPGIYKLLIGVILGAYLDISLFLLRYRRFAYLFAVST